MNFIIKLDLLPGKCTVKLAGLLGFGVAVPRIEIEVFLENQYLRKIFLEENRLTAPLLPG